MTWCPQAACNYLSKCRPRSMSTYGVTRPQWVNKLFFIIFTTLFSWLFHTTVLSAGMPFHSTTIFTLAYLLPLSLGHLPQQTHHLNLLSSITKALLTHTLASFWRKQSCLSVLSLSFPLSLPLPLAPSLILYFLFPSIHPSTHPPTQWMINSKYGLCYITRDFTFHCIYTCVLWPCCHGIPQYHKHMAGKCGYPPPLDKSCGQKAMLWVHKYHTVHCAGVCASDLNTNHYY